MTWGPSIDLPLVSRFSDPVSGLMVTSNRGLLGGTCQWGDGTTVGTFPVLLGGGQRGIQGAFGKYLKSIGTFANGTYSLAFFVEKSIASVGANQYLFDMREAGGSGFVLKDPTETVIVSSGAVYVNAQASTTLPLGMYNVVVSGITLSGTIIDWMVRFDLVSTPWDGKVFGLKLFPYALSPTQIRAIGERDRATLNLF